MVPPSKGEVSLRLKRIWMKSLIVLVLILLCSCKSNSVEPASNQGSLEPLGRLDSQGSPLETPMEPTLEPLMQPSMQSSLQSELKTISTIPFIQEKTFTSSIKNATEYELDATTKGIILPHHDVAAYMMGDLYSSLAKVVSPDIVYLIGPNHPALGKRFQIGNFHFATNSGILEVDDESVTALLRTNLFVPSPQEIFEKEHSLNIHLNYVKYYFKEAQVVPIIISEPRNSQSLEDLAAAIYAVSKDQNCIFISSIDFSHYLTLEEADKNDEITKQNLLENDVNELIKKSNDFVDCPAAIVVMLHILEKFGYDHCTILDHNNSANILHQKTLEATTSYFSVVYSQ